MNENPAYISAWKELRKKSFLFFGMAIGWPFYGVISGTLWEKYFGSSNGVFLIIVPYMILTAYMGFRRSAFRCPRCGKYFFIRGESMFFSFQNGYSSRCMNCGLPKNVSADPGHSKISEYAQKLYKYGAPMDLFFWPLVIVNFVLGGMTVTLFAGSRDFVFQMQMLPLTAGVSIASIAISMGAVFGIPETNHVEILKKVIPKGIYLLWIVLVVLSIYFVYGEIFKAGAVLSEAPSNVDLSPWTLPAFFVCEFPIQAVFNISVIVVARRVRFFSIANNSGQTQNGV